MTCDLPALPLVISIQSQVAYGHVGNSAAALAMRACGVEVIEVPTTLLSNHPRYPTVRGRVLEPELVADILTGLYERGVHRRAGVILSGFLGRAETAAAVAEFVRKAKAVNPAVVYACDPVMGDADVGFFADAALQNAFARELVPLADIIFPNAFELGALVGFPVGRDTDVARARTTLGCAAVVATSVPVPNLAPGEEPDRLATVTATPRGWSSVEVRRLAVRPAGTGDLLAGLTVAHLARGTELNDAVARAVAGVGIALSHTDGTPWAEMPIAAALSAIIAARAVDADRGSDDRPGSPT